MAQWLIANIGNIIVASVLLLSVILIIGKLRRDKKTGRCSSGCSCGCEGCGMCAAGRPKN